MYLVEAQGKIINLEKVSTFLISRKKPQKLIYNFSNPIDIIGKLTPDYLSVVYDTEIEALDAFQALCENEYVKDNFFVSNNPEILEVVNKNNISSISINEDKMKIIFNLDYSVSSGQNVISKFVFWDYNSEREDFKEDFERDVALIRKELKGKIK